MLPSPLLNFGRTRKRARVTDENDYFMQGKMTFLSGTGIGRPRASKCDGGAIRKANC
jgi:hypothetical protein